jgi:HK97 gp10 family phage protein
MASTTVRVEGLAELGRALQKLRGPEAERIARGMTAAAANLINKKAKDKRRPNNADAPYKVDGQTITPGNIAKNIITKRLPKAQTSLTSEHIVTVRSKKVKGKPYRAAIFAEFGTVKQAQKPFMRPAFEEGKLPAVEAMKKSGARAIERAAKKVASNAR